MNHKQKQPYFGCNKFLFLLSVFHSAIPNLRVRGHGDRPRLPLPPQRRVRPPHGPLDRPPALRQRTRADGRGGRHSIDGKGESEL